MALATPENPGYLRYEKPVSHPTGSLRGDGLESLHARTMDAIRTDAETENLIQSAVKAML